MKNMKYTYSILFTKFPGKGLGEVEELATKEEICTNLAIVALISALQRRYSKSTNILQERRSLCNETALEAMEAELLIQTNTKVLTNSKSVEILSDGILTTFPKAGFTRIGKAENFLQKRDYVQARNLLLETMEDYPEAHWLNMLLAQIEIFSSNYSQAAVYADRIPDRFIRNLYLFWSKFWYRHKVLSITLIIFVSLVLRNIASNAFLYVGSGLCFLLALYLLQYLKDRITPIWLIYLSVSMMIFSFF
ncbi:MAG: tetratricopeptide repeat protein [Anaerolineales bacterium]|nr:tetratricopeptide repeat protein [Anaerolineales bacterium]